MKPEKKTEILGNCDFLAGAGRQILEALAGETAVRQVSDGETVVTKGEPGSTMYFIVAGEVLVHDGEAELATLRQGEVFGEMAVLDADVRSASVTAQSDTVLLGLGRDALWRIVSKSPKALRAIMASILHRERTIVRDVTARTEQLLAYEKELEIGRRIQADFLPEYVPEVEGWTIASWFEAAREVAGDFYDVFELKPANRIALVIGDVCDKGVGAALFMTLFRSLIRASSLNSVLVGQADSENSNIPVSDILQGSIEATNRYIATTHSKSSMFASVFFGMLDPVSGEIRYINGGHESPVIFRSDGTHEILDVTGGVLGLFPFARFEVGKACIRPGDLFFSYTDGVNEAKNKTGDQFGDERILAMGHADWAGPEIFVDEILGRIRTFRGDAAQSDDITMLALQMTGEMDEGN